jgi:uncharacterized delta-60 repeat protein
LALGKAPIRAKEALLQRAHSQDLLSQASFIYQSRKHVMNYFLQSIRAAVAGLLIVLVACGGGGSEDAGIPLPAGTVVGAAGGTASGPGGAAVVIPAGALATALTIVIEQTAAGSPALPGGLTPLGSMFAFTPHGTGFAVPVTITVPFDPALVPAGATPGLYKTNAAQSAFEPVPGATVVGGAMTGQVSGFSHAIVASLPPLTANEPRRIWGFGVFPSNGGPRIDKGGDTQTGGLLEKLVDFGPAWTDLGIKGINGDLGNVRDGLASGYIFGTNNGATYGAYIESPNGSSARGQPPEPNGSVAELEQYQSYVKNSADATLSFTVSDAFINLADAANGVPSPGSAQVGDATISGSIDLTVIAFAHNSPDIDFFHAGGSVFLGGTHFSYVHEVSNFGGTPLWSETNFDLKSEFVPNSEIGSVVTALLQLKAPLKVTVDLSSVAVGEEFTLASVLTLKAQDRRSRPLTFELPTSVQVFLRDPLGIGGTTIDFTGLTPTNRPRVLPRAVAPPAAPAPCLPGPGPDPAAGVIQFSASAFSVSEATGIAPGIRVTRTGGSRGAVTARFSTSDGTAVAGSDYTPTTVTVSFADGDATPRSVIVPIVPDAVVEPDETVNLTLSQPGGCAALGPQTTAVLTIRNDDLPPPPPPPPPSNFGLDTTFGTTGKADTTERGGASTAFGGDRSAMALQADGKIVMVGGSASDFLLARFNADGNLDTSFGTGGKVVTDFGSGLRQEEALAVAIQNDGKIVVAGYTAIDLAPPAKDPPPTFAMARYNTDGSLDASFGIGGRVSGNVNGMAYAVAIQPDGKIVVAGEFAFAAANGSDFSDIVVARFNSNGSLDASFGTSNTGQITTDIGAATNTARNLVLQPDGAIVVSGKPPGSSPGLDHTDVVRYTANGVLDASFGVGGKLTLPGVDAGQGLARQADGKFMLVGGVTTATAPFTARFVLLRLRADGSTDTTFGTAGTVNTAFSVSATASAVALQLDGKIVVSGTTALSANSNFVVARYNADGTLDTGFSNGTGVLTVDFFGADDIAENLLMQPDGKIVVSGRARHQVSGYGVARINP